MVFNICKIQYKIIYTCIIIHVLAYIHACMYVVARVDDDDDHY